MYSLLVVMGLHYSRWWLMSGWMAHPVWNIGLHGFGKGTTFTLTWYAIACASFDWLVAAYITSVLLGLFNLGRREHES